MEKNRIRDRAKLLLIDEDEQIRKLLRGKLQSKDYKLYESRSGRQGMDQAISICPELILMDICLSDMDGVALIRWFREWMDCPILVVSREHTCAKKVEALYAGADDYMEKPFEEDELVARVYTALRRRIPNRRDTYEAGDLKIDFSRRQVLLFGEEVHFSPIEYRILECLALHSGTVVPYQTLLEKIWGPHAGSGSRILRVNMTNIRRKIEKVPADPRYIITIPRVGYRMLEGQQTT